MAHLLEGQETVDEVYHILIVAVYIPTASDSTQQSLYKCYALYKCFCCIVLYCIESFPMNVYQLTFRPRTQNVSDHCSPAEI